MTIELKTGLSREYRRDDLITKVAGTYIDRDCPIPLWTSFLDRVTANDRELAAYLKRVAGYCLTGSVQEHALFFFYGTGANGKSVFLNTLKSVWGDYAITAPMETFIETTGDRHPTELAFLHGARLVIAQETELSRRWAQAKIQSLTGGDEITARYMKQDFFTFRPQFKLLIAGNHKPSLSSVDEAIRRRFHLIPFTVTIPEEERDQDLPEKLKAEWTGIFAWAVDGCLEWQKIGLAPPAAVRYATDAYLAEEDTFRRWIDDRCKLGSHLWEVGDRLWNSWKHWTETNSERTQSRKWFGNELNKRGFASSKSQMVRGYDGIALQLSEDA